MRTQNLGTAGVKVVADISKYKRDIKDAKDTTETFGKKASNAIGGVTKAIGVMTVAASSGAFYGMIKSGADFEQQMASVRAVMRASENDFNLLEAAARKMGEETSHSATNAAEALDYMGLAGWSVEKSIEGLPGMLAASSAAGTGLARTSDVLTDVLTGMRMPIEDIGRLTDVMIGTTVRANTSFDQMGEAMKEAAPYAASYGFEIEEVSALIGILGDAQIKGTDAGTGLKNTWINNKKAAKELGTEATDLIGTLRAANAAQWDTNKFAEVYGKIAGKSVLNIAAQIDKYEALTKTLHNVEGETKKIADIKLDTTIGDTKILFSTIDSIGQSSFKNIKGELRESIQSVTKSLQENKEGISSFSENVDILSDGFSMLWDVASSPPAGLIEYFSNLADETKKSTEEINKLNTAIGEIKPPEQTALDDFLNFLEKWGNDTIKVFAFMGKSAGAVFGILLTDAAEVVKLIGEEFLSLGGIIWKTLSFDLDGAQKAFDGLGKTTESFLKDIAANYKAYEKSIDDGWAKLLADMSSNTKKELGATALSITNLADAIHATDWTGYQLGAKKTGEVVKGALTGIEQEIKAAKIDKAFEDWFGDIDKAEDALKSFFSEFELLKINLTDKERRMIIDPEDVEKTRDALKKLADDKEKFAKDALDAAEKYAKENEKWIKEQQDAWEHVYNNLHDIHVDMWRDFREGGENALDNIKSKAWDVFDQIAAKWSTQLMMNVAFGSGGMDSGGGILGSLGLNGDSGGSGLGIMDAASAGKTMWSAFSGGMESSAYKLFTGMGISGATAVPVASSAANMAAYSGASLSVTQGGMGLAGSMAAAVPYLAIAAMAIPLIMKLMEDEPDPRTGLFLGDHNRETTPTSDKYFYHTNFQDLEGRDERGNALITYFDAKFDMLDTATNAGINEILKTTDDWGQYAWVDPEAYPDDMQGLLNDIENRVWESIADGLVSDAVGINAAGMFDLSFFDDIAQEGEAAFTTFARFGLVVKDTDNFVARFTDQADNLGESSKSAFNNLATISGVMATIDTGMEAISTTAFTTTMEALEKNWKTLTETLTDAHAITKELTEAKRAENVAIGSQLTGLNANSIASALMSGGDVSSIMNTTIKNAMAGQVAESIMAGLLDPLVAEAGKIYTDTGGDLDAVLAHLESYDLTEVNKAVEEFKNKIGETGDAAKEAAEQLTIKSSLEKQWIQLTGDAIALRALAIEGMNAENVALYDKIEAYKAAEIAAEQQKERVTTARNNYIDAIGREISALENSQSILASVFESAKSAYTDSIRTQISTLATSQNLLKQNLDSTRSSYVSSINSVISENDSLISSYEQLAEGISDYKNGLLVSDSFSPSQQKDSAKAFLDAAAQGLFSGDDTIVQKSLADITGMADAFLNASKATTTDRQAYQNDVAYVLGLMNTAEDIAGVKLTVEEQNKATLEAQLIAVEGFADTSKSTLVLQQEYFAAKASFDSSSNAGQIDVLTDQLEWIENNGEIAKSALELEQEYFAAKSALDTSNFEIEISYWRTELDTLNTINGSILTLAQAQAAYQAAVSGTSGGGGGVIAPTGGYDPGAGGAADDYGAGGKIDVGGVTMPNGWYDLPSPGDTLDPYDWQTGLGYNPNAWSVADLAYQKIGKTPTNEELRSWHDIGNQDGMTVDRFYEIFNAEAIKHGSAGIPGLAKGGTVYHPTLAMIGEGGEPEHLTPDSQMKEVKELLREIRDKLDDTKAVDKVERAVTAMASGQISIYTKAG
jgi:TP901 family phage tail tape measure protein